MKTKQKGLQSMSPKSLTQPHPRAVVRRDVLIRFVHPIRSESLNVEYLYFASAHFKNIKVIKINSMYTGMCRGSNVKKGHLSRGVILITIMTVFIF